MEFFEDIADTLGVWDIPEEYADFNRCFDDNNKGETFNAAWFTGTELAIILERLKTEKPLDVFESLEDTWTNG